jgi:hypothetical protein
VRELPELTELINVITFVTKKLVNYKLELLLTQSSLRTCTSISPVKIGIPITSPYVDGSSMQCYCETSFGGGRRNAAGIDDLVIRVGA